MIRLVEGPSPEQVVRDAAGEPDDIDPRDAVVILRRMKINCQNLQKAVRWPGVSNRWSEAEKVAAEYQYQRQVEALDLAIATLAMTTEALL